MTRPNIRLLAIAVLALSLIFFMFKTDYFRSRTVNNGSGIVVVSANNRKYSNADVDYLTQGKNAVIGDLPVSTTTAANLPIGSPISRLHESVLAEDKDTRWGAIADNRIAEALKPVPYLTTDRTVTCGTIRCELSLKMAGGISTQNAEYVASRLYSIPNDNDGMGLMVEGVFPSVDADGSKRLNVIYMRH